MGRTDDALVVAERGRTRAFVDLLVERQRMGADSWYNSIDSTPVTKDMILDIASKQKAVVLYFSIAAGFLYSWLIIPDKGEDINIIFISLGFLPTPGCIPTSISPKLLV